MVGGGLGPTVPDGLINPSPLKWPCLMSQGHRPLGVAGRVQRALLGSPPGHLRVWGWNLMAMGDV